MNPTREPCRPSVTHRYAVSHRCAGSFCVDSVQLSRGRGCGCPGCAADPTGSFALPTGHLPNGESQLSDGDEAGVQCPGVVRTRPHCRTIHCGYRMPDRGLNCCGHRLRWLVHRCGDRYLPMILCLRICLPAGIGGHRVRRFPCALCGDVVSAARGHRRLETGGGAARRCPRRAVLRRGLRHPRVTRGWWR